MEYLPDYTAEHNRRHSALRGITGWAQINGTPLLQLRPVIRQVASWRRIRGNCSPRGKVGIQLRLLARQAKQILP
jgi:lipopolysaccharide/colanic/teichoic acid biosynthesis glycosyltransferase